MFLPSTRYYTIGQVLLALKGAIVVEWNELSVPVLSHATSFLPHELSLK